MVAERLRPIARDAAHVVRAVGACQGRITPRRARSFPIRVLGERGLLLGGRAAHRGQLRNLFRGRRPSRLAPRPPPPPPPPRSRPCASRRRGPFAILSERGQRRARDQQAPRSWRDKVFRVIGCSSREWAANPPRPRYRKFKHAAAAAGNPPAAETDILQVSTPACRGGDYTGRVPRLQPREAPYARHRIRPALLQPSVPLARCLYGLRAAIPRLPAAAAQPGRARPIGRVDGLRRRKPRRHGQHAAVLGRGPSRTRCRSRRSSARFRRPAPVLRHGHAERDDVDGVVSHRDRAARLAARDAGRARDAGAPRLPRRARRTPPTSCRQGVGHSVGTWDGNTLVIDTTLLSEWQVRPWPKSEQTHIVERVHITKLADVAARASGFVASVEKPINDDVLVVEMTLTDPTLYEGPAAAHDLLSAHGRYRDARVRVLRRALARGA